MTTQSLVVVTGLNDSRKYRPFLRWWVRYWNRAAEEMSASVRLVVAYYGEGRGSLEVGGGFEVAHYPPIPNFPTSTGAQLARLHAAGQVRHRDAISVTTDIDLFPLRPEFFSTFLAATRNSFIVRDVLDVPEYPICYLAAEPETWRDVVGDGDARRWMLERQRELRLIQQDPSHSDWYFDQRWMYSRVAAWEAAGGEVTRLSDDQVRFARLDRGTNVFRVLTDVVGRKSDGGDFVDYHAHRPVWRNEWLYRLVLKMAYGSNE